MPTIPSSVKKLVRRPVKDVAERPKRDATAETPTNQIEIPESSRERFGLFELFHPPSGQNVDIDIVAVHGIGGNWKETWTKNQKLWLRDFLPGNLRSDDLLNNINARILSYGYESEYFITRGTTGIGEVADSLLDRFNGQRPSGSERRPIIFIAHSLGGIVIKKAMNTASITPDYTNLKNSIIGVVFLGVPHRGADIAMWGTAVTEAMKTVSFGAFGSTKLLKALKKDSDQLRQISNDWKHGVEHLKIRTFYETKKLGPRLIVPQPSACLGFPGEREICLPISDSDHRSMCRFDEHDNQRYEPLGRAIRDLARSTIERPEPNLVKKTLSEKQSECLQALKTSDYEGYKHRANTPPRIPGTCQWCVKDDRYTNWRRCHESSILWVSADPGCGKSVLASYLVDELKSSESQMILPGVVCHFFFKDDNEKQKDATYALSALLHQLFSEQNDLVKYGLKEFQKDGTFFQDFHGLWRIFTNATADPRCPNVVCIIDALDECQEPTKDLLIRSLQDFFAKTTSQRNFVKFLLTSRPYPSIERKFCNFQEMKLARLSGENKIGEIVQDIDIVIQERVKEIGIKRELSTFDKTQLALFLLGNAEKTFLWVSLVLENIENDDDFNLIDITENTPSSVYSYYENMLRKSSDRAKAEKIFHIVLAARRPLTIEEMNCAYSIDLRTPDTLTLRPNIKHAIKGLCGLLLHIVDNEIHFIHQTAKEFLQGDAKVYPVGSETWKHSLHPLDSNIVLAHICISYLLSDIFKVSLPEDSETLQNEILLGDKLIMKTLLNFERQHTFIDYASIYWIEHLRKAQPNVKPDSDLINMVLRVCNVESVSYHAWWSMFSRRRYYMFDNFKPPNVLSLSSHFGLEVVIRRLLGDGVDIEARDGHGDRRPTALHNAVDHEHEGIVRLLIENGADIEAKDHFDGYGSTALHLAAEKGNEATVQLLLRNGADIEARNNSGCTGSTALHLAAKRGRQAVVQLLLENGAEIEARNRFDSFGSTALHLATKHWRNAVVRLLLKNGADIEARNNSGCTGSTALHLAAEKGNEDIFRMLLENGADIEARNRFSSSGETALHLATKNWHEAIVHLLLENRADIEARNRFSSSGSTALHLATIHECEEVVRLLLEKGANTEARNNYDSSEETALHMATSNVYGNIAQLLLEKGADIEARSNHGRTPLLEASKYRQHRTIQFLLNNRANIHARDNGGLTSLHHAALNGSLDIFRLLLENGANINAKDNVGMTATDLAECDQDEGLIKKLEEQGLLFPRYEAEDGSVLPTRGWKGRKAILQFIESSL